MRADNNIHKTKISIITKIAKLPKKLKKIKN